MGLVFQTSHCCRQTQTTLQTVEVWEVELEPDLNTLLTAPAPIASPRRPGSTAAPATAAAASGPSSSAAVTPAVATAAAAGVTSNGPSAHAAGSAADGASGAGVLGGLPGHMRTAQTWTYSDPFLNK